MTYWRLFYHFICATKNRASLLTPELEPHVHHYCTSKARELGALMFAINGVEDHLHAVAALPPRISPAEFVKRIKGASSRFVTKRFDVPFVWQEGYGVFSVSESDLEKVVAYVNAQKEHHRGETLVAAWERMTVEDDSPKRQR